MGTWGWGLFENDDAADVRDDFRHYVADAQDIGRATDAIARDFGADIAKPFDLPAFWLALAHTQWKYGWCDDRVTRAALSICSDDPWADKSRARAAQISKLRACLEGEPRPARPIPKPWPVQLPDFKVGEVIGKELPSGRLAVAKVIGFRPIMELKVRGPAIRIQKWTKTRMPNLSEAMDLEYLRWPIGPNRVQTFGSTVLAGPRRAPFSPTLFIRPGFIVPIREWEDKCPWVCGSTWGRYSLDDILETAIERWWDDPELPATAYAPWYKAPLVPETNV